MISVYDILFAYGLVAVIVWGRLFALEVVKWKMPGYGRLWIFSIMDTVFFASLWLPILIWFMFIRAAHLLKSAKEC